MPRFLLARPGFVKTTATATRATIVPDSVPGIAGCLGSDVSL